MHQPEEVHIQILRVRLQFPSEVFSIEILPNVLIKTMIKKKHRSVFGKWFTYH